MAGTLRFYLYEIISMKEERIKSFKLVWNWMRSVNQCIEDFGQVLLEAGLTNILLINDLYLLFDNSESLFY